MFKFSFIQSVLRWVIFMCFLSFASTAFAKGEWNASVKLTAKVNVEGRGYVYVSKDDTESPDFSGQKSSHDQTESENNIEANSSFSYSIKYSWIIFV